MKIKTSVEVDGSLSLSQVANATLDTNQFLVSDGGVVKYRTGSGILSDLGIDPLVKAGVAINKGQAVYVTTADGTNIIVGKASNLTEAASSKTLGLLNASVPLNGMANVITNGLLEGLDTSTSVIGDPVWLGENGNLIYGLANKPYAPKHLVYIGVVTRVNLNNGEIFINVQNGFELNETHDVDLKTVIPVNGHVLGYNGTLWVNKTVAGWLGYTPADDANVVHKTGNETITGTKTFNGTLNTTTSIFNLDAVDSFPTAGVPDAIRASAKGHNGTSTSLTTCFYGLIENNKNAGIWIENLATAPESTNSIGFRSSFKSTSTGNNFFSGERGAANVFRVSDYGDIYGTKIILGTTVDNLVDTLQVTGYSIATGYKIPSGLSSWFLKADGTYDSSTYVPTSRTLTINGVTQDLSANRTFTVAGSMSIGGLITSATAGSVLFAGVGGVLQQDNSQFFWDDTNNRLGIGTSSPTFKQHILVSGSTGDIAGFGLTGNTNNPLLLIKADATNQVITFRGGSSSGVYPSIAFDTGTDGERMRINTAGNVGIGTTSPSAKLHVVGDGLFSMAVTTSDKYLSNIAAQANFRGNWGGSDYWGIGSTSVAHQLRLGMTNITGAYMTAPGDMTLLIDGAATFTSSVTAGGNIISNGGAVVSNGIYPQYQFNTGGVSKYIIFNDSVSSLLKFRNEAGTDTISITQTGAATFASSVTATQFIVSASSSGITFDPTSGFNTAIYESTGSLNFRTNGVANLAVTLNGNVFVGTGSSRAKLGVSGNQQFTDPATGTTNGEVVYFGTGTTTAGFIYQYTTAGTWVAANASAASTSTGLLALALGTDPSINGMLLRGHAQFINTPFATLSASGRGLTLYIGTTAGHLSSTAPSATNQVLRVIGYCINGITSGARIYFCPDNTWITIA